MKIKLVSDFHEDYDHWFDLDGIEFRRMSNEGPTRVEMFQWFKINNLNAPKFGEVPWLNFSPKQDVVIYNNIKSHRGEGKYVLRCSPYISFTLPQTEIGKPRYYANFIQPDEPNTSYRYLVIGNKAWKMKYQSDEWRSNCGNVTISDVHEIKFKPLFFAPMYAIDFLISHGQKYHIDLNIAPGMQGIDLGIKNEEIFNLIKWWYENYKEI